jgi:hypothetical protein
MSYEQNMHKNKIAMVTPVAVAGILILAVLATILSTNQAFAYSSYYKGYYKGHHGYYKSYKYTRHGNIRASKSVTTGNAAQGASNTGNAAEEKRASNIGQGGPSSQPSGANVVQGAPSGQARNCKSAVTQLNAQWYPPYTSWIIRGQLTCGGSGLGGKTITLTNSKLSYVGKLATAVTREDGTFTASIKGAKTNGNTLSAWYLGGPDEGGISSKVITLQGGPSKASSNTGNTPQQTSNTGNTPQQTSNTGNTQQSSKTCDLTVNVSPDTAGASPHDVTGRLTCGGSGVGGATITFTSYKSGMGLNPNEARAKILSPAVTNADGTYRVTGSVCAGAVCSSVIAHYAGDSEHSPAKSTLFSLKIG